MYHQMNQEQFKQELLSEWEVNFYSKFKDLHRDPDFNKLNEIRLTCHSLYDLFYQLGISSDTLTDTCYVFSDIKHSDLSIILAETKVKVGFMGKETFLKDLFVMRGWHEELSFFDVRKYALFHDARREIVSYKAVQFKTSHLDCILSLKDDYAALKQITEDSHKNNGGWEASLAYGRKQKEIQEKLISMFGFEDSK
jgi:hypothetical protein